MLGQRVITASFLVAAVVLALWSGGLPLLVLTFAVFVLINWEYYGAALPGNLLMRLQLTVLSCLLPAGWLVFGAPGLLTAFSLCLFFLFLLFVLHVEKGAGVEDGRSMLAAIAGLCYAGLLGSLLVAGAHTLAPAAIAWLLIIVSVADTAAYLSGRAIGGPLMAPHISPKKTVAGGISGILFASLASVAGNYLLALGLHPGLAFLYGLLFGVLAVFGDLVESLFKRLYSVKDMSSMLPGHGGFLDRVDAVLFCLPVLLILS